VCELIRDERRDQKYKRRIKESKERSAFHIGEVTGTSNIADCIISMQYDCDAMQGHRFARLFFLALLDRNNIFRGDREQILREQMEGRFGKRQIFHGFTKALISARDFI